MLKALLCKLNLHDWTQELTEHGAHYRRCQRCGRREEAVGRDGDEAAGMH